MCKLDRHIMQCKVGTQVYTAFKFHQSMGTDAKYALKAVKAEIRAETLEEMGILRWRIEDDDLDPAEGLERPKDIAYARSHPHLWVCLETRDKPCPRHKDPNLCGKGCKWEHRESLGGISLESYNDPYLRVVKAELAVQAGLGEEVKSEPVIGARYV